MSPVITRKQVANLKKEHSYRQQQNKLFPTNRKIVGPRDIPVNIDLNKIKVDTENEPQVKQEDIDPENELNGNHRQEESVSVIVKEEVDIPIDSVEDLVDNSLLSPIITKCSSVVAYTPQNTTESLQPGTENLHPNVSQLSHPLLLPKVTLFTLDEPQQT